MCHNDFSSKNAMESNGWAFSWNDKYVFWPVAKYCDGVPSESYCGFMTPGDGVISYTFSASGTGTLKYGQSWHKGSVHVYMNNVELGSRSTRGSSNVMIRYSAGDVLQIKELRASVINIHSLCVSPGIYLIQNCNVCTTSTEVISMYGTNVG